MAWALYDWANSAFPTVIQTFLFAAYFTRQVAESETAGSAMWGMMHGIAGLVIAFAGPVLGAVADHTGRRKPWLICMSLVCIAATALLWFVRPDPDFILLAMFLVGLGSVAFEGANIFYNGMLAEIAPAEKIGRWSGWGWALGYFGGLACLSLALFGFVHDSAWLRLPRENAQHLRATFLLTAFWFLLFSIPLILLTPDSPSTGKKWTRAVRDGLHQIGQSIHNVRKYKVIVRFLIARMIYVDGLATVFAFGGVYAAGAFDMNEAQVLMFGIVLNVSAGVGAASLASVDDKLGSKPTIMLALAGLILTSISILLARDPIWFWVWGTILGIFVGPVQAASRSYLARTAPESLRNQMFGLYALSGKATSFLGPWLVTILTAATGSQRWGLSSVVVLLLLGFALIATLPKASRVSFSD